MHTCAARVALIRLDQRRVGRFGQIVVMRLRGSEVTGELGVVVNGTIGRIGHARVVDHDCRTTELAVAPPLLQREQSLAVDLGSVVNALQELALLVDLSNEPLATAVEDRHVDPGVNLHHAQL